MKNLFFSLLAILGLAGCSSDGSRTMYLEEFYAIDAEKSYLNNETLEDRQKFAGLISIVPGDCKISWEKTLGGPGFSYYNVSAKLKIRLNNEIQFNENSTERLKHLSFYELAFMLVDKEGNYISSLGKFNIGFQWTKNGPVINEDEVMKFFEFLQAKAGTETEILIGTQGHVNNIKDNCVKDIKSAIGLALLVGKTDEDFEKYWGKIK